MKTKYYGVLAMCLVAAMGLAPKISLASSPKVITGTVSSITTSGLVFSTVSGAAYSVDIAGASLLRKNGRSMQFGEFMVGDKIEIKGMFWPDNSISATAIRDLTLYAHTGTFSGKIATLDPSNGSFTVQSSQPAVKTIRTNSLTSIKKNSSSATLADLQIGMSVTIKGSWERQDSDIYASAVQASLRLVNIEVTGQLTMKAPNSFTIISNNTIYGADVSKAKLQNKSGKMITLDIFNLGDTIRVSGKHVSGGVQITASAVKDMSVVK